MQFTNSITGVPADDVEYKKAGVIQDGKYVFSETTGIKVGSDSAKAGSSGSLRAAIAVYTGYKYGVDPSDYEHINATVDAEKGLKLPMILIKAMRPVFTAAMARSLLLTATSISILTMLCRKVLTAVT